MTISQFLAVLRARWMNVAIATFVAVLLAAVILAILPTKYTGTAALVIDARPDPVAGMTGGGSGLPPSYLATQVDIITSDRVARKVVQNLKLKENGDLLAQWQSATEGKGTFEAWLAQVLENNVIVLPSKMSNVITVSYTAEDSAFAAALANAFVKAYLDTTVELRVDPAKQFSGFFDARAKQYRDALEQAQAKLSAFQKEHGIIATDERIDIETARLNELSSQLVAIQALAADSTSRLVQSRNSGDQMNEVLNNGLISGLKADLSRQLARMEELNARLGEAHPQVRELKANIAELRARIDAETRRVTGSVGITSNINQSREAQIKAALDEQRSNVLKMRENRDAAALLLRDVDSAQRAYDAVQARLTQTSLESQATLANASVLSEAVEPFLPSFPRIKLTLAASFVLGGMLGVVIALCREWADRRVRTVDDIALFEAAPLLLVMPGPVRRKLFRKQPVSLMRQRVLGQLPNAATSP